MLTTHTPVLVRSLREDNLRFIKKNEGEPDIVVCNENNFPEIIESLGVLPDHSVKVFFGVEGRNDISFLRTISKKLNNEDSSIPDLAKAEDEGRLVFIPLGGSSLDLWVSRINGLNRPQFYLMDRDNEPPSNPKYQAEFDSFKAEGHKPWITNRLELENYIHPDLIKADYANYTGDGEAFENVPRLFAQAVHEKSGSPKAWKEIVCDKEKLKKKESKAKKKLNAFYVSKMTKELLDAHDPDGELISWLQCIDDAL